MADDIDYLDVQIRGFDNMIDEKHPRDSVLYSQFSNVLGICRTLHGEVRRLQQRVADLEAASKSK